MKIRRERQRNLEYLLHFFVSIDIENAPEYMGSWTEGGKETFAVSNHLTRHALLINMEVDDFYKVPSFYSVLFELTGLAAAYILFTTKMVFVEPAILFYCKPIANSVVIAEDVPDITINH